MVTLPFWWLKPGVADIARRQDSVLPRVLADIQLSFSRFFRFFRRWIMPDERTPATPGPLNPNALSVGDAARLLARVGGWPVTEDMLEDDIGSGAPQNSDGTINLVHYGAWLVKEMSSGDRSATIATE
jgi:hypothetical protein